MANTYLLIGEEQRGPFSAEEISKMTSTGEITSETLCWEEGMPQWQTLSSLGRIPSALHVRKTIAPPRRTPGNDPAIVDFKNIRHNKENLSARTKPITLGKAAILLFFFFLILTFMIEVFSHLMPDAAQQFAEKTGQTFSHK